MRISPQKTTRKKKILFLVKFPWKWYEVPLGEHERLLTILKIGNKGVWRNVFWYVKICIFWKCIQYTIQSHKTKIFKKFLLDNINGTKNDLFSLLRDPTHHSFFFNLWFLYQLKHNVCLSNTVCVWHFPFSIPFRFY